MPIPTPDTHAIPPPAGRIVYRHPCDCPNASRPLEPGEEAEHRFDVDGEPFPWYLTEDGARFTKRDGHYLVEVDIVPIEAGGNHDLLDITISYWRRQPRIGDVAFPWAILDGSIRVDVLDGAFPMLHLTFIANEVDTDGDVVIDAEVVEEEDETAGYQRYLDRLGAGASSGDCWGGEADIAAAVNAPDLDLAIDAAEERANDA